MPFPTEETAESRRAAGQLIHQARKRDRLSQRELAKRAGISETWLRGLTVGLRGEEPQRATDSIWVALAHATRVDVGELFATLGRAAPAGTSGGDTPTPPGDAEGSTEHVLGTRVGRVVYEIVEDIAGDDDLSAEERAELETALAERIRSDYTLFYAAKREEMQRRRGRDA
ncbi:helix-turn-helix transcriptional regulator [Nocardiopsis sp. CT-R113]|uniref:Helix-turn-helix transcriptional regulator n=1 Tax=Nocardiopsis codii TaxID=3065942 RepID=A0ABU7KGB0_9ACTN|nr:helix-turn-helix transcriptional regulator [Nocardiopsis sp. CT-R113]MEE2041250.1 helix-turn-helix transcriptional regulator [Nocardiopsis sp. CT-R113]